MNAQPTDMFLPLENSSTCLEQRWPMWLSCAVVATTSSILWLGIIALVSLALGAF